MGRRQLRSAVLHRSPSRILLGMQAKTGAGTEKGRVVLPPSSEAGPSLFLPDDEARSDLVHR